MTNLQRIKDCFKATDDRRFDELTQFQSEQCHYRMNHDEFVGAAAYAQMCKGWYGGFPDLTHQVLDFVEEGNRVAYTVRITGTHTATMRTPGGDVPATGKRIDFKSVNIVELGTDQRAVSWHAYFDMLAMLQQLGIA